MQLDKVNTFIFDFDSTLCSVETLEEVLFISLGQNSRKKKKEIRKLSYLGNSGVITLRESINDRIKLASLSQKCVEEFITKSNGVIPQEMIEVVKYLKQMEQKVYIISGAFMNWLVPLCKRLDVPQQDIFASWINFDSEGNYKSIEPSIILEQHGKSILIDRLKKQGKWVGKITMVGDGITDYCVWERKSVDYFIGIGIFKENSILQKLSPYYFKSLDKFIQFIQFLPIKQ